MDRTTIDNLFSLANEMGDQYSDELNSLLEFHHAKIEAARTPCTLPREWRQTVCDALDGEIETHASRHWLCEYAQRIDSNGCLADSNSYWETERVMTLDEIWEVLGSFVEIELPEEIIRRQEEAYDARA